MSKKLIEVKDQVRWDLLDYTRSLLDPQQRFHISLLHRRVDRLRHERVRLEEIFPGSDMISMEDVLLDLTCEHCAFLTKVFARIEEFDVEGEGELGIKPGTFTEGEKIICRNHV